MSTVSVYSFIEGKHFTSKSKCHKIIMYNQHISYIKRLDNSFLVECPNNIDWSDIALLATFGARQASDNEWIIIHSNVKKDYGTTLTLVITTNDIRYTIASMLCHTSN